MAKCLWIRSTYNPRQRQKRSFTRIVEAAKTLSDEPRKMKWLVMVEEIGCRRRRDNCVRMIEKFENLKCRK